MKKIHCFIVLFFLVGGCAVAAESVWDKPTPAVSEPLKITVYRSPSCGCCGVWLGHLQKHGFEITDVKRNDMRAVKKEYGVPEQLASCHTAIIDGYVIEGHVPAGDIIKLIQEKPDVVGLSVPGMPSGTPGMEMGGRKEPFAVFSFDKQGEVKKFNEYLFY